MKHYIKGLCLIMSVIFCFGSFSSSNNYAQASQQESNIEIINELSKPLYSGRQSGTKGYDLAIDYLEQKLKNSGLSPLLDENSLRQKYEVDIAELKNEKVSINGKIMIIMKDYMPFSRTSGGKYNFNNAIYVGAGISSDYTSKVDDVVVFNWFDKTGKVPEGAIDRIQRAKQKGAKAVFIIADGELKVGNYEHPINGNDIGIPVIYISKEVASTCLNINNNFKSQMLKDTTIDIDLQIERKKSQSENLIGIIEGKVQNKAILITTNIDGFGSLPDGRYYQSAKAGAVAPAMFFDLINYYNKKKPEYSIIFALVGSKWTDNSGIKAIANALDFKQIICTIDLYAMGGLGSPSVGYLNKEYESFAKKISQNLYLNNDPGNSLSSVIRDYTSKSFIIRDQNTWIDDSLTDVAKNVTEQAYNNGVNFLKNFIDKISKTDASEDKSFTYDCSVVKTEYNEDLKKNLKYIESKYFNVYFDQIFKSQISNKHLMEIDKIYERLLKNNYFPYINGKVKLLYLSNGNDAAILSDRKDLMGHSERAGGGFASMDRLVIFCKSPSLGTVSHELNHLLVNFKGIGKSEGVIQECQGQSYLVYYRGDSYVQDASSLINEYLQNFEAPKVISNAKNYKTSIDWKIYSQNAADPDGWQNSYHILGSMFSFIKYNFGENAARRAIYRVYEDKANITSALCKDLNCSIDEFLEGWSIWMTSSGQKTSETIVNRSKGYKDSLNWYDFNKIFIKRNTSESQSIHSPSTSVGENGSITFQINLQSDDLKINSLKVEKKDSKFEFNLEYESKSERSLSFFNPPNGDIIMILKMTNGIKKGKNIITISVDATKVLSVDSITMMFYNQQFTNDYLFFKTSQLKNLPETTGSKVTMEKT